jgi:hypothetical protein
VQARKSFCACGLARPWRYVCRIRVYRGLEGFDALAGIL